MSHRNLRENLGCPLITESQIVDIFVFDPQGSQNLDSFPCPQFRFSMAVAVGGEYHCHMAAGTGVLLDQAAGQIDIIILMGNDDHNIFARKYGGIAEKTAVRIRNKHQNSTEKQKKTGAENPVAKPQQAGEKLFCFSL